MAEHAGTRGSGDPRRVAQLVCLVLGLVLVAAGALGFTVNASFDEAEVALDFDGDPVHGDLFLGLEVNGWHNIVHIATGALLLLGAASRKLAGTMLLVFGVAYVAVTVIGFIDGRNVVGIIPVNTADNYLHAALAAVAIIVAVAAGRRSGARAEA